MYTRFPLCDRIDKQIVHSYHSGECSPGPCTRSAVRCRAVREGHCHLNSPPADGVTEWLRARRAVTYLSSTSVPGVRYSTAARRCPPLDPVPDSTRPRPPPCRARLVPLPPSRPFVLPLSSGLLPSGVRPVLLPYTTGIIAPQHHPLNGLNAELPIPPPSGRSAHARAAKSGHAALQA